jgi:hypothetical protein
MSRPKGRETHVIITTYDLPRPEAMPHDAITTPDGHAWYRIRSSIYRRARSEDGQGHGLRISYAQTT